MSYSRWGWNGSDVYIFGTEWVGQRAIECCDCHFADYDEPGAFFDNYGDLLRHISDHRAAGHHVPDYVDQRIREEIADPTEQWVPVGELPEVMHPDPGIVRPEPESLRRIRDRMDAYRAAKDDPVALEALRQKFQREET